MEGFVSIPEAAKLKKVTRQAIYLAVRMNKIKAYDMDNKLRVSVKDLNEYDMSKWSRKKREVDGQKIVNEKVGTYSINGAAELLGVPTQKLYYAVRMGDLKATRWGGLTTIDVNDLLEYRKRCLTNKYTRRVAC